MNTNSAERFALALRTFNLAQDSIVAASEAIDEGWYFVAAGRIALAQRDASDAVAMLTADKFRRVSYISLREDVVYSREDVTIMLHTVDDYISAVAQQFE